MSRPPARCVTSLLIVAAASILGCRPDQTSATAPGQRLPDGIAPRTVVNAALDGSPGECSFSIPVVPDGNGSLAETSTNCTVPDSVFVAIRVRGTLLSSTNPDAAWCVPSASAPAVGPYGPMGGGGIDNWMRLLVTVRGFSSTAGTFSIPARDTATGGSLSFGSSAAAVAYGDGFFIGKGSTLLKVLRSGNLDTVSCNGPLAPYPPGCAGGTVRSCGPINKYRVNGTQVLTVKPAAATLILSATPTPAYEGDTITFTASSTDARAVSVRSWTWRDSLGNLSTPSCAVSGQTCKLAPLGSGRMFVRARVGTNPYVEQASTAAILLPLELTVTASPNPTSDTFLVEYSAASSPVSRRVTGLTFQSAPSTEQIECLSDRCYGISTASTTVTFSALVNRKQKQATVQLEVLPTCAPSLSGAYRLRAVESSCLDPAAVCYGGLVICLRPLTEAERSFVRDSVIRRLQDSASVPAAHQAMCAELARTFKQMLADGKVYMGIYNTAHTGNTTTGGRVHIDRADFDSYRSQYIDGRTSLMSVYLHETVHYLFRVQNRYTNHTPRPTPNAPHLEYPYSVLDPNPNNPCVRWGPPE
jgi:hypothetical protein